MGNPPPSERRAVAILQIWVEALSVNGRAGISHHDLNALSEDIARALEGDGPFLSLLDAEWERRQPGSEEASS